MMCGMSPASPACTLRTTKLAKMQQQMSAILDYVNMLQTVDVSGVEPTAQVTDVVNVVRPDAVTASLPVETVLAAAPDREGDYFRVKPVFE